MKTAVIRRSHFNAAHQLWNKQWDKAKNKEIFGLCANENYHGHNYIVEIKVSGEVDPDTGYVLDLKILNQLIHEEVYKPYDHKNLNLDTEDFKDLNPTVENIARVIYEKIRKRLNTALELQVKIWETDNNMAIYPA